MANIKEGKRLADAVQIVLYNKSPEVLEMAKRKQLSQEQLITLLKRNYDLTDTELQAVMTLSNQIHGLQAQDYLRERGINKGTEEIINGMLKKATATAEVVSRQNGEESLRPESILAEIPNVKVWEVVASLKEQAKEEKE